MEVAGHARPGEIVTPLVETHDRAINTPYVGELGKVGVRAEGVRTTCDFVRLRSMSSSNCLTLEHVRTLKIQVVDTIAAGSVVDVPSTINVVQFRCPHVAASVWVAIRPDYFGLPCLQPSQRLRSRD